MREGGRQDDGLERFWGWQTRLSPRDGAHLLDEGRRVLTTCGWRLRRGRLNFAAVDGRGGVLKAEVHGRGSWCMEMWDQGLVTFGVQIYFPL